ncbi:hypothetical protein Ddye_030300 [Dipteronia dyeriana]|uniref:RRM domain-containing protein n=1 Tax=Dipteronia dyeriana TaxID=168575 RepID=A0AAD9WML7_9ROSI|nr:hypothetical protein Ddye_030300 [Dipteronia dyeriana]
MRENRERNFRFFSQGGEVRINGRRKDFRDKLFSVYVDNMNPVVDSTGLWGIFKFFGRVRDVFLSHKKASRNSSFGFIRFGTLEEARKVASLRKRYEVERNVGNVKKYIHGQSFVKVVKESFQKLDRTRHIGDQRFGSPKSITVGMNLRVEIMNRDESQSDSTWLELSAVGVLKSFIDISSVNRLEKIEGLGFGKGIMEINGQVQKNGKGLSSFKNDSTKEKENDDCSNSSPNDIVKGNMVITNNYMGESSYGGLGQNLAGNFYIDLGCGSTQNDGKKTGMAQISEDPNNSDVLDHCLSNKKTISLVSGGGDAFTKCFSSHVSANQNPNLQGETASNSHKFGKGAKKGLKSDGKGSRMCKSHGTVTRKDKSKVSNYSEISNEAINRVDPSNERWVLEEEVAKFIDKCVVMDGRLELWRFILNTQSFLSGTWVFGGDFNTVLNQSKRIGGPGSLKSKGLGKSLSDHNPIVLGDPAVDWGPRPFRFQNEWCFNKELMSDVRKAWKSFKGSLVGTAYEILAKVLANRLKWVMDAVISPSQMAFVKGRHIIDSFVIAEEVIHSWKRADKGGLLVKLDFGKAYDSVDHEFLFQVLSIIEQGLIKGVSFGNEGFQLTHLQFVDDTILFIEPIKVSKKHLDEEVWARAFRCVLASLLIMYLGMPLGGNLKREALWSPVVKKVEDGLALWKRGRIKDKGVSLLAKWIWHFGREHSSLWKKVICYKYRWRDDGIVWDPVEQKTFSIFIKSVCRLFDPWSVSSPIIKKGFQLIQWFALSFWLGIVPPKVEVFLWQLFKGRILVSDVLLKFGMSHIASNVCPLCDRESETINHLFLHLPVEFVDSLMAEILAIHRACALISSGMFLLNRNIFIMSDSKSIVSWIIGDGFGHLRLVNFMYDIRQFLLFMNSVSIIFTPSISNSLADNLAKAGTVLMEERLEWGSTFGVLLRGIALSVLSFCFVSPRCLG